MRCKVLHQGRASTDDAKRRYEGFSFGQPIPGAASDHLIARGGALNIEVHAFSTEAWYGVERWMQALESSPGLKRSCNAQKNLATLVRVREVQVPAVHTAEQGNAPLQPLGTPTFVT